MKFLQKTTGKDGVEVFDFRTGIEEVKLLHRILRDSRKAIPNFLGKIPEKSRLNTMRLTVEEVLRNEDKL